MDKRTTIILVAVFAALAGYMVLTGQNDFSTAPTPTPAGRVATSVWPVAVTIDRVASAAITHRPTNRTVAWDRAGAGWQVTLPITTTSTDPAAVDRATTSLLTLTGYTLTTASDLSAFGVLSPTYTLYLTLTDGQRLELVIGDKTPTGSQFYGWRAADATLFTINSFALDSVWQWLESPPVAAPTPTAIPLNTAP